MHDNKKDEKNKRIKKNRSKTGLLQVIVLKWSNYKVSNKEVLLKVVKV